MRCHWQAFLKLLPLWLKEPVDRLGRDSLTELRLRTGSAPELVLTDRSLWLTQEVTVRDLNFCINAASEYSPWAAGTMKQGYLTAPGGHRIGICGETTLHSDGSIAFQTITSLCIRVARDFSGIATDLSRLCGSVLIIGPPGSGKSTLLRDLIRQKSDRGTGSIAVIDERGELFPMVRGQPCFPVGKRTDIMTGLQKSHGIITAIRTMGPALIAVDEITDRKDCEALIHAMWCGVDLFVTAHASNMQDLRNRKVYKPLIDSQIFDTVVVLRQDRSWRMERMHYDS